MANLVARSGAPRHVWEDRRTRRAPARRPPTRASRPAAPGGPRWLLHHAPRCASGKQHGLRTDSGGGDSRAPPGRPALAPAALPRPPAAPGPPPGGPDPVLTEPAAAAGCRQDRGAALACSGGGARGAGVALRSADAATPPRTPETADGMERGARGLTGCAAGFHQPRPRPAHRLAPPTGAGSPAHRRASPRRAGRARNSREGGGGAAASRARPG